VKFNSSNLACLEFCARSHMLTPFIYVLDLGTWLFWDHEMLQCNDEIRLHSGDDGMGGDDSSCSAISSCHKGLSNPQVDWHPFRTRCQVSCLARALDAHPRLKSRCCLRYLLRCHEWSAYGKHPPSLCKFICHEVFGQWSQVCRDQILSGCTRFLVQFPSRTAVDQWHVRET